MEKMYHGFMTKNADGTNKIIGLGEQCQIPTKNPFWKRPHDIKTCRVKTRSCTRKDPIISLKEYNNYFQEKQRISQWILRTEPANN